MAHMREDLAANLHTRVTKEGGCVKIFSPPFNDSVGIIYANIPDYMSIFRFVCEMSRVGVEKCYYVYDE